MAVCRLAYNFQVVLDSLKLKYMINTTSKGKHDFFLGKGHNPFLDPPLVGKGDPSSHGVLMASLFRLIVIHNLNLFERVNNSFCAI